MGASRKEFVLFVGISENFLNVDALDCREAVLDEEGVGLPFLGAGAAICRRDVFDGFRIERYTEG